MKSNMKTELLIAKKPKDVSMLDYFSSLDVFDKRNLIGEITIVKAMTDLKVKNALFTFITSIIVGLSFSILLPTTLVISFYSLISICIGAYLIKKIHMANTFSSLIKYLEKNM